MRVLVMHNPTAGTEDHRAEDLIDEIHRAGHEVVRHVRRRKELEAALELGAELVVAAGGDGTVNKVAKVLRGTGVPFVIVPLGTANNTARALAMNGLDWWNEGVAKPFDLALARIDDDWKRFVEAIGFGAFPRVIDQAIEDDENAPKDRLTRDRRLLRARVAVSPLKRYEIHADGEDLSGEYFMVEAMNIAAIGPRVAMAPKASPHDGLIDLVLAREEDREPMLDALDLLVRGRQPSISLPSTPAKRIRIVGDMRRYHRDGDLRNRRTREVEISVEPGALQVLVPPTSIRASD